MSIANDLVTELKNTITTINNFPKQGVVFYDIMPILRNPCLFAKTIRHFVAQLSSLNFDIIIAPEARGFLLASPLALLMQKSFIAVRKPGKLPGSCEQVCYSLEYGEETLEISKNAIKRGQKALIFDDVLATAGTTKAIEQLVIQSGARVTAYAFLIEIVALKGRQYLNNSPAEVLLAY